MCIHKSRLKLLQCLIEISSYLSCSRNKRVLHETCVMLMKLGNLSQPFLILRRKLGSVMLLRVFYIVLPQKHEGNGYP